MQITSTRISQPLKRQAPVAAKSEESTFGVTDRIADGYHSLPRWPKAMVRGVASYSPASIGAMIGSQYGGLPGRIVGAAVGSIASYKFLTDVAEMYPRQAKMSAAVTGVLAAVQGGAGLSLSGVGVSMAWGAGIGALQEFVMGR